MKLKWYGHSAFRVITNDGTRIIFDPYEPNCYNGGIAYAAITDPADIVLISHEHPDHNWAKGIPNNPIILKGSGNHSFKNIPIKGIGAYHDKSRGKERGHNTIFNLELDNIHLCHLGDLGHKLTPSDASIIGPVNILLIPVGEFFTIDNTEAHSVIELLKPNLIIPMHYKTNKCGFPIKPIATFIGGFEIIKRITDNEIEITDESLPNKQEIWVISHTN